MSLPSTKHTTATRGAFVGNRCHCIAHDGNAVVYLFANSLGFISLNTQAKSWASSRHAS